jgi:GNAT superfamily N-acetyltransferase
MTALLDDPEVLRFTRVPEPPPHDFPRQWLDRYVAARVDGTAEAFAAVDGIGTFVGLALAPTIDNESGEVELGYIVAPAARGRGVATAMLAQLTSWAFATGATRGTCPSLARSAGAAGGRRGPFSSRPPTTPNCSGYTLGDGHSSALARTERLRIFLDAQHSTIVDDTDALLRRCFPENRVGRVHPREDRMVVLWLYHGHLSCLFPQHGPGKKHERPILLEPWQQALVEAAPWAFLRGCIRSDGCVFINRTGKYEYLSYEFKNRSPGIRELFAATCDRVGVACRVNGDRIAIYRRSSVALLLEHVGIKS